VRARQHEPPCSERSARCEAPNRPQVPIGMLNAMYVATRGGTPRVPTCLSASPVSKAAKAFLTRLRWCLAVPVIY
jgi:hypothetical protein